MPATHLALLRGINVGGKNKLPMKDLASMFTEAGCETVKSYIQSGNVIFCAKAATARRVSERVAQMIAERFGHRTTVVLRTRDQVRDVVANNPFLAAGMPLDRLHVVFLADLPNQGQVESLDPRRSSPDEFIVRGQEIYLHLPSGVADSKLTNAYFDSKLATVSTGRNWRTVTKLLEMMDA
jgi:uncharacterized protein (DUF1697 family)